MSRSKARRSQIAHRCGAILGALGIVVVELLSLAWPGIDVLREVLLAVFVLILVRSLVGYLFPGFTTDQRSPRQSAAPLR